MTSREVETTEERWFFFFNYVNFLQHRIFSSSVSRGIASHAVVEQNSAVFSFFISHPSASQRPRVLGPGQDVCGPSSLPLQMLDLVAMQHVSHVVAEPEGVEEWKNVK